MRTLPQLGAALRRITNPHREELDNCRPYLIEELRLLKNARVIVALGKIAFDNVLLALAALADRGVELPKPRPAFGHEAIYQSIVIL